MVMKPQPIPVTVLRRVTSILALGVVVVDDMILVTAKHENDPEVLQDDNDEELGIVVDQWLPNRPYKHHKRKHKHKLHSCHYHPPHLDPFNLLNNIHSQNRTNRTKLWR
jgi:hypothetical protein